MKYIFVTVGTTKFEGLIRAVDSEEFCNWAKGCGFESVLVQRGAGEYSPTNPIVQSYQFKPSLHEDMAKSSLVISHAGSGSILESLELNKPTIVVVNTLLMDNHQLELASKLQTLGYVSVANGPQELLKALESNRQKPEQQQQQSQKHHNFGSVLDEDCGMSRATKERSKSLIVLGSGGHTTEMIRGLESVNLKKYQPRTYLIAETDSISPTKATTFERNHQQQTETATNYKIRTVPRSREVGQSYFTSVWTTIVALFWSFLAVWNEMPDIILCNGPGTCVPIIISARTICLIRWHSRIKVVYFESVARVKSLSLSGKILYHFVDHFIVQWPELKSLYPHSLLRNFSFPL